MSWDDLVMETAPVVREVRVEKPKIEKPKDDQTDALKRRIRELERVIEQQNEQIRELENRETEITAADKRNLQFLVNCVAKTYQNEFRKQRAPAVKLALTNIIEKFGLETPDEMES